MERSLIKQVNKKNMSARLNSRHVKPMYYPNFFTPKRVTSLKWETLVGEKGAPVFRSREDAGSNQQNVR